MSKIPLKTRLRVINELYLISLLTELGYREDKPWTPDEDEKLNKLVNLSVVMAERQIEEIKKFLIKKIK